MEQPEQGATFYHIDKFNNFPSPDFKSIYANNAVAVASFFDLVLTFGEVQSFQGGTLNVEQRVKVTMSVPHAKVLLLVLSQQIKSYEARFGEISIPPEVIPPQLADSKPDLAQIQRRDKNG